MIKTHKSLEEYRHLNNLPKKLEVEVDGYGMYNTAITYSMLCLYKGNFVNSQSKIDLRKLINNDLGVYVNLRRMFDLSLSEITFRVPKGEMVGLNMVILMDIVGKKQICILHKFKNTKHLFDEFEYIFKSVILEYKKDLTNPHK